MTIPNRQSLMEWYSRRRGIAVPLSFGVLILMFGLGDLLMNAPNQTVLGIVELISGIGCFAFVGFRFLEYITISFICWLITLVGIWLILVFRVADLYSRLFG